MCNIMTPCICIDPPITARRLKQKKSVRLSKLVQIEI